MYIILNYKIKIFFLIYCKQFKDYFMIIYAYLNAGGTGHCSTTRQLELLFNPHYSKTIVKQKMKQSVSKILLRIQ